MCKALLVTLLSFLVAVGSAIGQEKSAPEKADPLDASAALNRIRELGLPTTDTVDVIENQAQIHFAQGECAKAMPLLEQVAKQANWLANLIAAGLQPFYTASYDDRKRFSGTTELVPYERLANRYKTKRNQAMVMQAECLVKMGQNDRAASLYLTALNLISIDDGASWIRARKGLFNLVGVR